MIHSTVGLAVTVNETFFAVVVVLDTASSWTGKGDFDWSLDCLKVAFFSIFLLELETLIFDLVHEVLEVFFVILPFLVSPDEVCGGDCSVVIDVCLDEDVFEDALGRDGDRRNVVEDLI